MNLYAFVYNSPLNWVDVLGNIPYIGVYGSENASPMTPERAAAICKQKVADQNKRMARIVAAQSGKKKPDCSGEVGCELISIIIDLGNPCVTDLGHMGIAVGNQFYDTGPGGGPYWSVELDGNMWMPFNEANKQTIRTLGAGAGQLMITYCGCKASAQRIKDAFNADLGYYDHCTNVACSALGVEGGFFTSPNDFANSVQHGKYSFASNCGKSKGEAAFIEIFSKTEEP